MAPGRLHVYLGAIPAAGKTHALLAEGRRLAGAGNDVVVALVETHGRAGLEQLADGLEVVPRRRVPYRGTSLEELDTDAVLARRPGVALVDELAHSNVPGSPRDKRWQDVEELLSAGIDVVTTLNVQHLAGARADAERITGVPQREVVPDEVVLAADRVDFVDTDPRVVMQRIREEQAGRENPGVTVGTGFFELGRLEALRELARAWLAGHGLAPTRPRPAAVAGLVPGPVVVALAPGAPAEHAVRRAAELAALRRAALVGVSVRDTADLGAAVDRESSDLERMLAEFGGRYAELGGTDVALELARFAEREQAGVLVIGDTSHSMGRRLLHGSVARRTLALAHGIEIYVVPPGVRRRGSVRGPRPPGEARGRPALPPRRRAFSWLLAVVAPLALMAALSPARSSIGLSGALVCALLAVVAVALTGGAGAAILATGVVVASADFFFAAPYHSLRVTHLIDLLALAVFAVVGAVVGVLIQVLAGRRRQTARSLAEADRLARLAASALADPAEPTGDLVTGLRTAFDLDAVGILARGEDGWRLLAGAGGPLPARPDAAQFAAEIGPGRVLVMSGSALDATDAHLLRTFTDELLLARRRSQLDALEATASARPARRDEAAGPPAAEGPAASADGQPEGRKRTPEPGSVTK
jgi:two-component system, OmpR family, sensor histidine kinase KdpD